MSNVDVLLKLSLDTLEDWDVDQTDRSMVHHLRGAVKSLHAAVSALASDRAPTDGDAAFIAGARTATETSIDMVTARLRRILKIQPDRGGTLSEMFDRVERWLETEITGRLAAVDQIENARHRLGGILSISVDETLAESLAELLERVACNIAEDRETIRGQSAAISELADARHRLRSMIGTTSETMTLDALLDWVGERLAFAVAERDGHAIEAARDTQTIQELRGVYAASELERAGLRHDMATLRGHLRDATADLAKARDCQVAAERTIDELRARARLRAVEVEVEVEGDEARFANHSATILSLQASRAADAEVIRDLQADASMERRRREAAERTALALRAEIDASKSASMPRRFVVGDEVIDDSASPTLMRVARTWNKGAILACEYTSGGMRYTRVVRADLVRPLTPDDAGVKS